MEEYISERTNITKKKFEILIVDDDTDIAKYLKDILILRGHTVTIVDEGPRCITHCNFIDKKYDIVFMDYHMDHMDGGEVSDIIRDKNHSILIFAFTGDNSKSALSVFKNTGMNGAIIKPVDIYALNTLMDLLENNPAQCYIQKLSKYKNSSIIIFANQHR